MDLADPDLRDLAEFLSKRLPPSWDGEAVERPAAPDAAAWAHRLQRARDDGSLHRLFRKVAATDPEDANLQSVCALLSPPAPAPSPATLAVAGGLGLGLGLALLAGLAFLVSGARSADVAVASTAPADPAAVAPPPTPMPAPEVAAAPVVAEGLGDVRVEAAPATPAPEPVVERAAPASPAAIAAVDPAPGCTGAPGEVVGYWYAGGRAPGAAGDTVVVPWSVNVRATYPGDHNGWNTNERIRCVLREGDVVRLSKDPIPVPKDTYWVPLVAGDLVGRNQG